MEQFLINTFILLIAIIALDPIVKSYFPLFKRYLERKYFDEDSLIKRLQILDENLKESIKSPLINYQCEKLITDDNSGKNDKLHFIIENIKKAENSITIALKFDEKKKTFFKNHSDFIYNSIKELAENNPEFSVIIVSQTNKVNTGKKNDLFISLDSKNFHKNLIEFKKINNIRFFETNYHFGSNLLIIDDKTLIKEDFNLGKKSEIYKCDYEINDLIDLH